MLRYVKLYPTKCCVPCAYCFDVHFVSGLLWFGFECVYLKLYILDYYSESNVFALPQNTYYYLTLGTHFRKYNWCSCVFWPSFFDHVKIILNTMFMCYYFNNVFVCFFVCFFRIKKTIAQIFKKCLLVWTEPETKIKVSNTSESKYYYVRKKSACPFAFACCSQPQIGSCSSFFDSDWTPI